MTSARILCGDVRDVLPTLAGASVQCCVTSPPYWGAQRDYGMAGQLGMERTPEGFRDALVGVFREVRRVLCDDGVLWLNLGDSYAASGKGGGGSMMENRGEVWAHRKDLKGWRAPPPGYKQKDLVGVPWMVAFALRADGWYLRRDVVWEKARPTEPTRADRPSTSHEMLFLLAKAKRYAFDQSVLPQSSVWRIQADGTAAGHVATFPQELVRRCVFSGSREGDTILDPFAGSGTVGVVALKRGRSFLGVELNPTYAAMARDRIHDDAPLLNVVETSRAGAVPPTPRASATLGDEEEPRCA